MLTAHSTHLLLPKPESGIRIHVSSSLLIVHHIFVGVHTAFTVLCVTLFSMPNQNTCKALLSSFEVVIKGTWKHLADVAYGDDSLTNFSRKEGFSSDKNVLFLIPRVVLLIGNILTSLMMKPWRASRPGGTHVHALISERLERWCGLGLLVSPLDSRSLWLILLCGLYDKIWLSFAALLERPLHRIHRHRVVVWQGI